MTDPLPSSAPLYTGSYLSALVIDDGLIEILLNRQGESVNKLDEHFTAELAELLKLLGVKSNLRGVLLTSAKPAFLAGADLSVLQDLCKRPQSELIEFARSNGAVLTALEDLPVPTVTAITGFALGGGLEVALCTDYRVLASDAQVGFPEVGLGVIPGWGGTVRLPRLSNGQIGLEWVVGAKSHKAEKALTDGIVDVIAKPDEVRASALALLQRAIANELPWQQRRQQRRTAFALDHNALADASAKAQKTARFYPAGLAAVKLLEACAPLSRDAALVHEAETFAQLAKTPTASALVGNFLSNQWMKKLSRSQAATGTKIQRAAVLGAGIMGGGIAYTTAVSKISVVLKDIAEPALDRGIGEAKSLLSKQVTSGRLSNEHAQNIIANISATTQFDQFDKVDLVIEAIVENLDIKRATFAETERHVKPGTVLASNTSSLLIGDMVSALQHPENLVGMHFFNPVPVMPLVEIIRGPVTSDQAIATAVSYVNAIGKTPLVVKDCAGFLVNRLLGAYMTAFLQLIHEGADFQAIDRAMEAWGWPMGPAYLMDVAGIDTLDKAFVVLSKAYPNVMATGWRNAIQLLASEGRYGQKTGAGFYTYHTDDKGRLQRSTEQSIYELLATIQPQGINPISDSEIEQRLTLAMIIEASRCLEENIVSSAAEIDVAMRLATGFPAHHGGPLWYADSIGLDELRRRCEAHTGHGGIFVVNPLINKLIDAGHHFYHDA